MIHSKRALVASSILSLCLCLASVPQSAVSQQPKSETKLVEMGQNVSLEIANGKRRVIVKSYVCLREGLLEMFLCRKYTKEHEAVLAADVDARDIHKALVLAGAEPGSPVKFQPKYEPAKGTVIKLTLQYQDKGKLVTVPAQKWVRDIKTKKDMTYDWVFAGSVLVPNPLDKDKPPSYAANYGDVICLANFESAMLDLPIKSSKDNEDLAFEANPDRIPPLQTPVTLILEPVLPPAK